MHTIRQLFKPTMGLLLLAGLLLCGCDKDEPSGGGGTVFSVQFDRIDIDQNLWVVVQDPMGLQALAAQEVPQSGRVEFANVPATRITCTIIRQWEGTGCSIECYMNVPAGAWHDRDITRPDSVVGNVDLTLQYPPAVYDQCVYSYADNIDDTAAVPASGTLRITRPLRYFSDTVLSADATVYGAESYCGWLTAAPFVPGDTNRYTLDVTHPVVYTTITTNRPCTGLAAWAYKGASSHTYNYWNASADGSSVWQVPLCSIPADRREVVVSGSVAGSYWYFGVMAAMLPAHLDIPTTSIDALYDPAQQAFTQIALSGSADYEVTYWDGYSGSGNTSWSVFVRSGQTAVRLPVLPDTLRTALGIHASSFAGRGLACVDIDILESLDDFIRLEYQSAGNFQQDIGRFYGFRRWLDASESAVSATAPIPDPTGRRFPFSR